MLVRNTFCYVAALAWCATAEKMFLDKDTDRTTGHLLEGECAWEVETLSTFRCNEYREALERGRTADTVTMNITRVKETDCMKYEVKCIISDPVHGDQVLVEIYDFKTDLCNRKVIFTYEYTLSTMGVPQTIKSYHPLEIGTGEEVLVPNLLKIMDSSHYSTQAMRVHLRDGTQQLQDANGNVQRRSGYFFRAEIATKNPLTQKYENNFSQWMMINTNKASPQCPDGLRVTGASYHEFHDTNCQVLAREVTYFEADGLCSLVSLVTPGAFNVLSNGSALCEDDTLYLMAPTHEDICLHDANNSFTMKQKADISIKLSTQRATCLPYRTGSIQISAGSCKPTQDMCVWRKGKYGGKRVLIQKDVTQYECLVKAMLSVGFTKWCGVAWDEVGDTIDGDRSCWGIEGACDGLYAGQPGEWGCLIKSSGGGSSNKSDTATLVIFLVIICVLCPLLLLVVVIAVSRYQRRKTAEAMREGNHMTVDSGRTTGVVTGVPVPAMRPAEDEEEGGDEGCSVAPFEPDPNVTTNPLKQFDGDEAESEAVDGRLETQPDEVPSPIDSPTYNNEKRPLAKSSGAGARVPPPLVEDMEAATPRPEDDPSNVSTENMPF
eukprot:TRINITY_DN9098_c0_g1_i1.p1 TRINITY_DN9098_c0_g1~~TRINITY_DN9098_c0_g1_i1.p1  ORF type:complete len:605 (+),score=122.31 TRINITY_DN9098_c0_g1_i1:66-1880(+)